MRFHRHDPVIECMSDSEKENNIDASEQNFTLSARTVRKMTREEFGYELSMNAFDLLNWKAKEKLLKGCGVGEVNDWAMRVLEGFKGRRIVKRSDIELVMEQTVKMSDIVESEKPEEKSDITNIDHASENTDSQKDQNSETTVVQKDHESETSRDHNSDTNSDTNSEKAQMVVDIVQLPSLGQADMIKEMEDEIERLKRIIQIILNKQAELV